MVRVHLSRPVQVKGKGDRGDPDFRSLSSLFYGGRFLSYQECVGEARPGKDGLDREAMPTLLVTTKRRSQERKEGLEPSTSALARLCSTIKLFPPATVVAKHY